MRGINKSRRIYGNSSDLIFILNSHVTCSMPSSPGFVCSASVFYLCQLLCPSSMKRNQRRQRVSEWRRVAATRDKLAERGGGSPEPEDVMVVGLDMKMKDEDNGGFQIEGRGFWWLWVVIGQTVRRGL